jgi:hypothetical protein
MELWWARVYKWYDLLKPVQSIVIWGLGHWTGDN